MVYSTFMNLVDEAELKELGAERVFTKPGTFAETVDTIKGILTENGERRCA